MHAFVPSVDPQTRRIGLSNGKPGHNMPKWAGTGKRQGLYNLNYIRQTIIRGEA